MGKSPILTIIVPIYNVEKYLNQCILSLVNQTLTDIEIILVDDESPDRCPQMCDEWAEKDHRIKVIHKKNGGLGFARNSGIDIATGEYVTFVDSDDIVDMDAYGFLLNRHLDSQPDAIFYRLQKFCDSNLPPAQKEPSYRCIEKGEFEALKLDIISADSHIRQERTLSCSACTSLYKRELLERHHIRFHSERELVSEDMIFNLDFLSVASKVCLDFSTLYFYRYNPDSLTHTVAVEKLNRFATFDSYLRKSRCLWELPSEAENRISRLTIGNYRAAICQTLISSQDKCSKQIFFEQAVSNPTLKNALAAYPCMDYPLFQKLFSIGMKRKLFLLAMLLAYLKKYNKH